MKFESAESWCSDWGGDGVVYRFNFGGHWFRVGTGYLGGSQGPEAFLGPKGKTLIEVLEAKDR